MQGMDLSTCPTVSAPEPRAALSASAALAGLFGLQTRWASPPATPHAHAAERTTTLAPGQTLRLQARTGQKLTVRSGRVWATLTGWPEDRWLDAGQSWVLPADGRLVIEGGGGEIAEVQW